MSVGLNWVGKVQAVLGAARPQLAEEQARRGYELYDWNTALPLDTSQAAKEYREITRIARWYAWGQGEVSRVLDAAGVATALGLDDAERQTLLTRMKMLEDCTQNGCDPPDAPAAS